MGCSPSNIESVVIVPVENKSPSPPIFQRSPSTQQSNRIMENCIVVWVSSRFVENTPSPSPPLISFEVYND